MAFERITVNPERMGGKPCIRDVRVTVTMVLGRLAGGRTIEQVLADYPCLEREDVLAALDYAAAGRPPPPLRSSSTPRPTAW